ncbi:MAG: CBS domain-containing protein [Candidatus Woesearchaeota archaeon]
MRSVAEIKRLRKLHDITQSELSKLANVSQSLIAKVESGRIDASYTNVQKIFDCLDSLKQKKEPKAEDIMTTKIFSIAGNAPVSDAIRKMRLHEISQLPVVENDKAVGIVTETDIIAKLSEGEKASELLVRDVAGEAPPTIPGRTPLSAVTELLRYAPLVLVSEKGRLKGVITKADVLYRLSRIA